MFSSAGTFVLKRKPSLEKVIRERAVLEYLHRYGVAAHTMLATYQTEDGQVYCQYRYVAGATLIDGTSDGISEVMGEAIGQLHKVLKFFEGPGEFPLRDLYDATFSWVLNSITTSDNETIMRLARLLTDSQEEMIILKQLPKQLVHRDAHGGNMVFDKGHFQGFLDFDLMEVNIRLFDPCYCAMGVLPRRFKETEFRRKWVNYLGEILRGYNRVCPLTLDEIRSIWFVVIAIEALFVAIFMKNSPEIAMKNAEICSWLADIRDEVDQLQVQFAN